MALDDILLSEKDANMILEMSRGNVGTVEDILPEEGGDQTVQEIPAVAAGGGYSRGRVVNASP